MSKKFSENLTASDRAELASRVKTVRIQLGLTQQELADAAGVTRQSVGNIETGTTTPQAQTLVPVLKALGIAPSPAKFSPETSRWLAIVGGIMDSLPESRKATAGQAAVSAVTQELVNAANVRGAGDTIDLHTIDLGKGDVALAATRDGSTVEEQTHPVDEDQTQETEE